MVVWLIFKVLKKIFSFFVTVISLPFRLLYSAVKLAIMLYNAKDVVGSYISFLPTTVIAIIGFMVGVAVFYKIVGREG